MGGFVLSVMEGREMISYVGPFYVTGDDVGGTCVGLLIGGTYEIYSIQLNEY